MISDLAVVQTNSIGKNVWIGEFAIVRPNVTIGNDVVIHANAVINPGVIIGNGVEIFPGAYLGKEPKGIGVLARQPVFERRLVVGSHTSIGPYAIIYYDVEIGENTLIGEATSIREQSRIGSYCVLGRFNAINYNTHIGNHTKVLDFCAFPGNCRVGESVFISAHVCGLNDNSFGKEGYTELNVVGPTIENGASIGAGAILFPKIIIGKNAIVGAGSVVTKNVEPGTIVMGIPARCVRQNIPKI